MKKSNVKNFTIGQFDLTSRRQRKQNGELEITYGVERIAVETGIDTQYDFKLSGFEAIDGANLKIGDQFLFTLSRITATADEYAGDSLLATVGIHYQHEYLGSSQISTK